MTKLREALELDENFSSVESKSVDPVGSHRFLLRPELGNEQAIRGVRSGEGSPRDSYYYKKFIHFEQDKNVTADWQTLGKCV